ncbi:MAG: hypothetical protein JNM88_11385 [Chitinophagaceae bacterium]|nr:hypothetical protein [Chitinophagaceae bacterium]
MRLINLSVIVLSSCIINTGSSKHDPPFKEGVIRFYTTFITPSNDTTFAHYSTIWYKDSACIMEVRGMNSYTALGKTTRTNPIQFYRYIDLRARKMWAYRTLADTAKAFKAEPLPDSTLRGGGWNFYTEKLFVLDREPVLLADTLENGITYKRARIHFTFERPDAVTEGWFIEEGRGTLFSYEKAFSRKMNWTMVRSLDYGNGLPKPWAIQEIRFLSDTVGGEEGRMLEVWRGRSRE